MVDRNPAAAPRSRAAYPPTRTAALLTALLASVLFVGAARLSERYLDWRVDLSDDGLSGWSPTASGVLDRLEDLLAIELFFSGDLEHAAAQLYRRGLMSRIDELAALGGDRVRIVISDPSRSSADRLRAERLGIRPEHLDEIAGTSRVQQDVYFGAVLRYRGDEVVLPFLVPSTLEYEVASAVWRLTQPTPPKVGWSVGVDINGKGERTSAAAEFGALRSHLERRYEVIDVFGLENGVRVPPDVAALVLVAPRDVAPRAVFEVDQFVRRGGSLLVLGDRSRADEEARAIIAYATGLESLLESWGAPLSPDQVFDRALAVPIELQQTLAGGATRRMTVEYPLWLLARDECLDAESPITARFPLVSLRWAHAIEPATPPAGVTRTDLVRSSNDAFLLPVVHDLRFDAAAIDAVGKELLARMRPASYGLLTVLDGTFPSAFDGELSPPALAPATRAEVPGTERASSTEPARRARVALVGDADWARNAAVLPAPDANGRRAPGFSPYGSVSAGLLDNLVDWMTGSEELVALRARVPKDRRLVDFEAEARAAEGAPTSAGIRGPGAAAERAREAAQDRRLLWTAGSMFGSLVFVAGLALLSHLRRRAAPLVRLERETGGGL